MKVVGFNFKKINIERLSDGIADGGIKINTNIDIPEIVEADPKGFPTKDKILGIKFSFTVNYEPDFAKVSLEGGLLFAGKEEKTKEILKEWENKNMPDDFKVLLFNFILRKANVKALQLEEELNLPLHVALPSLKKKAKDEK